MNVLEINILVLAYLGDTVYENYVRRFLIDEGITNVDLLQKRAVSYVSAKRQAVFLKILLEQNFFTDDEMDIIKRARNYKSSRHPKSCDIITYKHATALEAVIGYLNYIGNINREKCIMNTILGGNLC